MAEKTEELSEKRRVTIDSNIIIASVFSKGNPENSASQRVIVKYPSLK